MNIFWAEDDERTCKLAGREISAIFPDSQFVFAHSVEEAERKIESARASGLRFDIALLDAELPDRGLKVKDTSLCDKLTASGAVPDGLTIHCTAFANDPVFQRHVEEKHVKHSGPRGLLVTKGADPKDSTYRWDKKLIQEIARHRLERQLDAAETKDSPTGRESGTFAIASLISDIRQAWKILPAETQRRIRRSFDVLVDDAGVHVKVGGSNDDES